MIFAAVVIAWAVFLVPWALRRYDEATGTRSVDKVSKAMRLLGRTRADTEDPEPVAAPSPLKRHAPEPADRPLVEPPPRPSRNAARAAAERRRRVLLILVGLTAVTGAIVAFGVIPVWSVAIPGGLVVAFLALCRWQVRREDDAAWVRRRTGRRDDESAADATSASQAMGDEPNDDPTVALPATAEARDKAKGRQAVEAGADPVAAADLVESVSDPVSVRTSDGNPLWDPLPVTLPTYVDKAKANRSVRTIDLGAPDTWTSGHVKGERTELPSDERSDSGSDDTDARRPAVGD